MPTPDDHALSFGAAADDYDRARPTYPDDVVDWLLDDIDGLVVDVGAGTGKLTRSLAARRNDVVAVEPDAEMRSILHANVPGAESRAGTAEHLPLAAGTAGLVTMAHAWHWVDVPAASTEIARALGRPGRLGLVWNYRSPADPWVARLTKALGGADSAGQMDDIRASGPTIAAPFGSYERRVVTWDHVMDVEALVSLAASRSYVIVRPQHEREQVLAAVRALGEERAGTDGSVPMPYETYAFRYDIA